MNKEDLTPAEIKKNLEERRLWLDSGLKKGKRANFSGKNLREVNLRGANLEEANLGG